MNESTILFPVVYSNLFLSLTKGPTPSDRKFWKGFIALPH